MIYLCAISNIRSGSCNEDCKFCTQSAKNRANIKRFKKKEIKDIINEAKIARKYRASGFCLVTSGKELDEDTLDYVIAATKAILKEVDISIIACNGLASYEMLKELKKAGVKIYNHNLESSKEFYKNLCTTHDWEDRFKTCQNVKKAGLRLCSGGIFGVGESLEDIDSLILSLKELDVDGIAINFFVPNKNLPITPQYDKSYAIEVINRFKKSFFDKILMIAGGRELIFKDIIEAINTGANSVVIGDYLTTKGEKRSKDLELLKKFNIKIANEC